MMNLENKIKLYVESKLDSSYEFRNVSRQDFIDNVKSGDPLFFYTNRWWALFAKFIRLFSVNINNLAGWKADHAVVSYRPAVYKIQIAESVLTHAQQAQQKKKWTDYFYKFGGINVKILDLKDNPENNLFEICKAQKKTLMYLSLKENLNEWQKVVAQDDIELGKTKNWVYLLFLALLSEILPKFILRTKFGRKYLAKTTGVFCSLFVCKHYKKIGVISQEEYDANPLPSPAQLAKFSCFKRNAKNQVIVNIVNLD